MEPQTIETLRRLSQSPDPMEARALQSQVLDALGPEAPIYADLVASLVARVDEMVELERLAGTDPLTHAVNRRGFVEALERELSRAARSGDHVAVVLVDLDQFKALNDDLGHLAGDRALTAVARALESAVRAGDVVARLGGDEFAALLAVPNPMVANVIAERIREAVERIEIGDRHLSTSIGVASTASAFATTSGLLSAADEGLYADKRRRRARFEPQAA
jgi:diguanylate cyclase (GGDEF)-like protein